MRIERELFINAGINHIYQLDEYQRSSVYHQVAKEFDEMLDLNDLNILQRRSKYFGVGEASDYINRLIETDEGDVIVGIRHLGGDRSKPYLLVWPSFEICSIKKIATSIKLHFEVFKPEIICYWSRPDCSHSNGNIIQKRYLGKVAEMTKCDLVLSKHEHYYEWYKSEYAKFHHQNPEYINRIQVNSKEAMEASFKEDLLYIYSQGENKIGLIAGERNLFLDKPAIYLSEILIARDYRGKGYANKLLASFVNGLNADYFICDIDSKNTPSTNTALRSGQSVFSQEIFVQI